MREQRQLTQPMWLRVKGEHHRGMLVEGLVYREVRGGYLVRMGRGRRLVFGFLSLGELQQQAHATGETLTTLKVGDSLSAYVDNYDDSRMQLQLTLRQAGPREIVHYVESTALGTELLGRVVRHGSVGVFVRLANGFDALLPMSEIPQVGDQPVEEILRLGDQVAGVVFRKDPSRQQMHLSVTKYLEGWRPDRVGLPAPVVASESLVPLAIDYFQDDVPKARTSRRVVVLEDDQDILAGLVDFLERCGHQVRAASTLDGLFTKLAQYDVGCVVLDLMVHGELVLTPVLERLRREHPKVKVITCSAYYDPDVTAELVCARGQVIDALLKPVSLDLLAERVESCEVAGQFEVETYAGSSEADSEMPAVAASRQREIKTRQDALNELFGAVCRRWPRQAVLLVHRSRDSREPEYVRSERFDRATFDRERLQLKYSPIDDVIRRGEGVRYDDLDDPSATWAGSIRRMIQCSAMIGAPVMVMGEPEYGIFVFQSSGGTFFREDLEALERIARESCLPLERIRNLEAVTQDHIRLSKANLLAGVAHETNNTVAAMMLSLQGVQGYLSLLEQGGLPGAEQKKLAEALRSVSGRGNAITKILRSFLAGMTHGSTSVEEVYRLVFEMMEWIRPQAELAGIDLVFHLESTLAKVKVPQLPLQQSIFNLVLNAVQQLQQGPCRKHKRVEVSGGVDESRPLPVWIAVTDTGPGVHEDHRERIFEAYYTTRKDGSGLGLYLTRWCIESLGGRVFVDRTVRFEGARFRIELPDPQQQSGKRQFDGSTVVTRGVARTDGSESEANRTTSLGTSSSAQEAREPHEPVAEEPIEELHRAAFERERQAFERMESDLLAGHHGLFVAVRDGRIVDEDPDEVALARRLQRDYPNSFVLVRQVGHPDPDEASFLSPESDP